MFKSKHMAAILLLLKITFKYLSLPDLKHTEIITIKIFHEFQRVADEILANSTPLSAERKVTT